MAMLPSAAAMNAQDRLGHDVQQTLSTKLILELSHAMMAADGREPNSFSEAEVDLLVALTSLAGVALENMRLQEETRAQAHRAQVVADMARIISSTLDMPNLLVALMHEIQRVVPCIEGSFAFY